jgi:hypothetical protein
VPLGGPWYHSKGSPLPPASTDVSCIKASVAPMIATIDFRHLPDETSLHVQELCTQSGLLNSHQHRLRVLAPLLQLPHHPYLTLQ